MSYEQDLGFQQRYFPSISLILTRFTIFGVIYTVVLGLPVVLGLHMLGPGSWLIPMSFMAVLALGGPFIYFYLQRRTDEQMLKEQREYQETLRQASAGMGRIRDKNKLFNLIVFILTRSVRMEHAMVYFIRPEKKVFELKAIRHNRAQHGEPITELSVDEAIIRHFKDSVVPVRFEEVCRLAHDTLNVESIGLAENLTRLHANLAVPIYLHSDLAAIVLMGKKESGRVYTEDDVAVFSILANQTALALENAQFYEDIQRTQEQLFQADKMATIGTMADGLSHQINNRFHAMGFVAGDALDTIKLHRHQENTPLVKGLLDEMERAFTRIEENVSQGGEIVRGLLRYTRKGDEGITAISLAEVFKSSYEMTQFKIKAQIKVDHLYPDHLPKIKGNFTQMQEVFFNMIDNAYDAMKQRQDEMKEPGYEPYLTLTARAIDDKVEITLADNGMGVKEEDQFKLFTPFFSTKLSSKKGTGLGLYVIQKIIKENHEGDVKVVSHYGVGTKFILTLPAAQ